MKAVTAKMLISLIGILLVAPFFAIALIIGARAVALSHGAQDDLLLIALALGGAAVSIVNGMGRRTDREKRASNNPFESKEKAYSRSASMIHLGY
jgi:NADH:ubiquinone oxidoreductase subunit 3 (subunit A)